MSPESKSSQSLIKLENAEGLMIFHARRASRDPLCYGSYGLLGAWLLRVIWWLLVRGAWISAAGSARQQ